MPRFIAVHSLPITEDNWEENMKGPFEKISQLPSGVKYNLTYCGFTDGKFFCDWEAPNKETIDEIFKDVKMPYDAIYPVKLFNVAKMDFED